jgi:hypothetical protein
MPAQGEHHSRAFFAAADYGLKSLTVNVTGTVEHPRTWSTHERNDEFLSVPGRTGTQWIGNRLARHYGDLALVEHEPIHADYAPRRALRAADLDALAGELPVVAHQLEHIGAVLAANRDYIEAGWCVYPWVPWFIGRYPGQVRLVHFTRHPVRFACSMETHGFYHPELRDDGYTRDAQLEPTDAGVKYINYQQRLGRMCPFEKCLYQWLEVNAFALELRYSYPDVPYLHIRSASMNGSLKATVRSLMSLPTLSGRRFYWCSPRARGPRLFQLLQQRLVPYFASERY